MEDTVPGVPGTLPDTLLESGTPPAATPSAASAYSADAAWGLVSADTPQARSPLASIGSLSASSGGVPLTGKELNDLVCQAVDSIYSKHGGPFQYLNSRYETDAKRLAYAHMLWKAFPPDPQNFMPRTISDMPKSPHNCRDEAREFTAHLAMISFHKDSTSKELPRAHTAQLLTEHILMDGFVTAGEVLILNSGTKEWMDQVGTPGLVPWADGPTVLDPIPMFAFSHHKSAARVATLHVICSLFLDDEVDMKAVHPVLWHSICNIRAINLSFPTMRAQSLVQHYPQRLV